jgi:hypothetical protein
MTKLAQSAMIALINGHTSILRDLEFRLVEWFRYIPVFVIQSMSGRLKILMINENVSAGLQTCTHIHQP